MNDEIRAALVARLEEKGMSRADLARAVGKHPNAITRALNGLPDGGRVPELWAAMLDAVDARLTVTPGRVAEGQAVPPPARAKPGRKPTKSGEGKTGTPAPATASSPGPDHGLPREREDTQHGQGQAEDLHKEAGGNFAGQGGDVPLIDAAPLFDEAGKPARPGPSSSPSMPLHGQAVRVSGVPLPAMPQGQARQAGVIVEALDAGGKLATESGRWVLTPAGQHGQGVRLDVVQKLFKAGVLASVEAGERE